MDLLERYLQSIRTFLPRKAQDDILRELSENILSQMEEKEAELGRPLTEAEQEEVIKQHGHPIVVAARYGRRQYLIGPRAVSDLLANAENCTSSGAGRAIHRRHRDSAGQRRSGPSNSSGAAGGSSRRNSGVCVDYRSFCSIRILLAAREPALYHQVEPAFVACAWQAFGCYPASRFRGSNHHGQRVRHLVAVHPGRAISPLWAGRRGNRSGACLDSSALAHHFAGVGGHRAGIRESVKPALDGRPHQSSAGVARGGICARGHSCQGGQLDCHGRWSWRSGAIQRPPNRESNLVLLLSLCAGHYGPATRVGMCEPISRPSITTRPALVRAPKVIGRQNSQSLEKGTACYACI